MKLDRNRKRFLVDIARQDGDVFAPPFIEEEKPWQALRKYFEKICPRPFQQDSLVGSVGPIPGNDESPSGRRKIYVAPQIE